MDEEQYKTIHSKLDFLSAEATSSTRKNWIYMAIGVFATIVTAFGSEIAEFIAEAFSFGKWLLAHDDEANG